MHCPAQLLKLCIAFTPQINMKQILFVSNKFLSCAKFVKALQTGHYTSDHCKAFHLPTLLLQ